MGDLKVVDLYNRSDENKIKAFNNKIESNLRVVADYEKVDVDLEWLDIMDDTVKYLDNILRNPNKFIVNEEEVIKIELAKRVTVESIKHLSRNTNLIQDYNKKTGDVKPSKILNVHKEESFDTYENRFIYSLIQNMKFYITKKKQKLNIASSLKDNKKFEYNAKTTVGKEQVDLNVSFNSKLKDDGTKKENDELAHRIEMLEIQIRGLCNQDVYKTIDRLHITLVTSPIKKTNVINKNVNFQYAVKLWNYMQSHPDDEPEKESSNKDYMDKGELKDYFDETFLFNYLTSLKLNGEGENPVPKEEISEKMVSNMVSNMMNLNQNMSLEELQKLVGEQYQIIKYRNVINDKKIQEAFKDKMDKYLSKLNDYKI